MKNPMTIKSSYEHKLKNVHTNVLARDKPAIPRLTSATGNDPSNQYDHHLIQNKNEWENHRISSIICKLIYGLYI